MRDCGSLQKDEALTVNRSVILVYDPGRGVYGAQPIAVRSAKIILTRGPLHPKVPVNTIG
jgi:hypothetical protein